MGKHRGDEHWELPLQPEPTATPKDYWVLLLLLGCTAAFVLICCGFGLYMGSRLS